MKLRILGWEAKGFRCPDCTVNLCNDSGLPHKVSFIQMPNGTGKTTTLTLLRDTISGRAQSWRSDEVEAILDKNSSYDEAEFIVKLEIDNSIITFRLIADSTTKKAKMFTTKGRGQQDGWEPPTASIPFFNEKFISFLVLDGELAKNLTNPKKTDAKQAITDLFQLYLLDNIKSKFEEYLLSQKKKYQSQITVNGTALSKLEKRVDALCANKEYLIEQRSIEKMALEALQRTTESLEREYESIINSSETKKEQYNQAKDELTDSNEKLNQLVQEALIATREPQHLNKKIGKMMRDLREGLDRLKLPRATSSEFFNELIQEPECICGTLFTDTMRDKVIKNSPRFLDEDEIGVLNSVKLNIGQYVSSSPDKYDDEYTAMMRALLTAKKNRDAAETKFRALNESYGELSELGGLNAKINTNRELIRGKESKINEFDRPRESSDIDNSKSIEAITYLYNEAKNKWASSIGLIRVKDKIDLISKLLVKSSRRASRELAAILTKETNETLSKLLPLEQIELRSIQGCLEISTGGASEGQGLALAYGFIKTLFSHGSHDFPLVVDSPAGPIDKDVRPELAKIVHKTTNQFVAFTISTERDQFTDKVENYEDDIQYLTLFRKSKHSAHLIDVASSLPSNKTSHSENGILIESKEYFNGFQDEGQEA